MKSDYKRAISIISIAVILLALSVARAAAEEKPAPESEKKDEKTEVKKLSKSDVRISAADFAARLGDKSSKVRKEATQKLIDLAETPLSRGADDKEAENVTARDIVIAEMKKHTGSKDPEISETAKEVIARLETEEKKGPAGALPDEVMHRLQIQMEQIQQIQGARGMMRIQRGGAGGNMIFQINGEEVQIDGDQLNVDE